MIDNIKGLTVSLTHDIRKDDCQPIIDAIVKQKLTHRMGFMIQDGEIYDKIWELSVYTNTSLAKVIRVALAIGVKVLHLEKIDTKKLPAIKQRVAERRNKK